MLSEDEKQFLGKVIATYQAEEKARYDSGLGNSSPILVRKGNTFFSIGLIIAGLGPLLTVVWMASRYDTEFRSMKAESTYLRNAVATQSKQIDWLKMAVGAPSGRWTYSMEAFTLDALIQANNLKGVDYMKIHDNLINYNMPIGSFPAVSTTNVEPPD